MMPRSPGEVLMENKVARTYAEQTSNRVSAKAALDAPEDLSGTAASSQRSMSEEDCLLKGDPAGSARLAEADERTKCAVERHATKDPGVRGILKRASVVCHPESESQKRFALDTEQDPTPHPRVSYEGSSALGARPSATTSSDQGGTSDAARASGVGRIDGGVAMGGDNADDDSARHPNQSGSGQQKEGHGEERTT